jgi:translation elongation factor EF-G
VPPTPTDTPQALGLHLYQTLAAKRAGDGAALAEILARCHAKDSTFIATPGSRNGEYRAWARSPRELASRVAEVTKLAAFPIDTGPVDVQARWTPGRLAEAEHRLGSADGAATDFAVVRLRVVPRRSGEGNLFESEFAGPPQIDAVNDAVARGIAQVWAEGPNETGANSGPIIDTQVVFIDGAFHATRSTPRGFERAAVAAFRAACALAGMRRLEPLAEIEIQVGRDYVLAVIDDLSESSGRELRRRLSPAGVVVSAELPLLSLLTYEAHLTALTGGKGTLLGEPRLTRWGEVRRR